MRGTNQIDVMVGRNIRFQRLKRGISQEALADRLGITFQQVQKYEKGANRTSASRLVQIAAVFGVDIPTLFDGVDVAKAKADKSISALVEDQKAMSLLLAFNAVKDPKVRSAIVHLVSEFGSSA